MTIRRSRHARSRRLEDIAKRRAEAVKRREALVQFRARVRDAAKAKPLEKKYEDFVTHAWAELGLDDLREDLEPLLSSASKTEIEMQLREDAGRHPPFENARCFGGRGAGAGRAWSRPLRNFGDVRGRFSAQARTRGGAARSSRAASRRCGKASTT